MLLADGATRAIEDIRIGDRVIATDPKRSVTAVRPVTNVITTEDDKDFTRLTVTTDHGPATITATDNHPFWWEGDQRWKDAGDLRAGDDLRTPNGAGVAVTAVRDQQGPQRTHDLTVSGLHTYYVLAGQTPVLVHNSTCIQLRNDLAAAEAANPLIESLQQTGGLPSNYVTKAQAAAAGWKPGKALGNSVPGGQIGGDVFANTNGVVPRAPGRTWQEADLGINPMMSRAKQPGQRLLYSNDGLAYVTSDHYKTAYQLPNWR